MTDTYKRTTLTGKQWINIRAGWESGTSIAKIARTYGISRTAINYRAKRDDWKPRGSIGRAASDKTAAKLERTFEEIATEVCDRHIETFRAIHDLARANLRELALDAKMIAKHNAAVRIEAERELETGKLSGPLRTMSVCRHVSALQAIAQIVRIATIEGERLILGLTDYKRLHDSAADSPINRIVEVITAARAAYEATIAAEAAKPKDPLLFVVPQQAQ